MIVGRSALFAVACRWGLCPTVVWEKAVCEKEKELHRRACLCCCNICSRRGHGTETGCTIRPLVDEKLVSAEPSNNTIRTRPAAAVARRPRFFCRRPNTRPRLVRGTLACLCVCVCVTRLPDGRVSLRSRCY